MGTYKEKKRLPTNINLIYRQLYIWTTNGRFNTVLMSDNKAN